MQKAGDSPYNAKIRRLIFWQNPHIQAKKENVYSSGLSIRADPTKNASFVCRFFTKSGEISLDLSLAECGTMESAGISRKRCKKWRIIMNLPQTETEKTCILLKESLSYLNGEPLSTRLLLEREEGGAAFLTESAYLGERACVRLGRDPETAIAFFLRVAGGEVTPVILQDVLEDFFYEQKNVKKSLYIC
ncbi:MAG: hypothetical protein IIY01_03110 [Clostridia bacterium]|nr:hypothetical protein [Clostridia bacterium]MBQ5662506.1 hypothetical protein [Clostridia bacterium]